MARLAYDESSSAANPVLDVWIRDVSGAALNPATLAFRIFDFTTGSEVQVWPASGWQSLTIADVPTGERLATGHFYAPYTVVSGANIGTYRIRWQATDGSGDVYTFTEEFEVIDVSPVTIGASGLAVHEAAALGLDCLATETATRVRRLGGHTNGAYAITASSNTTIAASIQPTRGRDLRLVPEGKRGMETITIYTRTPLRTAAVDTLPDRITYQSLTYEVEHVAQWPPHNGVFTKAVAVRLGD